MQLTPVLHQVRASLESQRALAGDDPAVGDALGVLLDGLEPALRIAAMDLAQQAATEVAAQLDEHTVDVVIVDGDPALRVTPATSTRSTGPADEDFDARITLRLPPSLKTLIEDAATGDGDSVNSWVVDALKSRAAKSTSRDGGRGARVTEGFDL